MYLNTKSSDESSSSNLNSSFKCIMNDNDSGYISQHIESNSLGEVSDYNNHIVFSTSNMYLNEDALLENPVKTHSEYEHLYYMSDFSNTIIPPSVSSHGDSFHVFDSEDSEVMEETETSLVIPVADPIVVSDLSMEQVTTSKEDSSFIVDDKHSIDYKHSSHMEKQKNDETAVSTLKTNNLSCVQTRIMDANNCNMSLFESFYSFVCDLYTTDAAPLEEISSIAVNSRDLLVTQVNEQMSSYIQLETRSMHDLPLDNTLPTASTTDLPESPTSAFVNSFLNPINAEDSSSQVVASCSPSSATTTSNSKDVESMEVTNNNSTSVTFSEKVQSPANSTNFVGAFNSVGKPEISSPQVATIVDNSGSSSKFPESPKTASSLTNENTDSGCCENIEISNVSTKTTTAITDCSAIIAKATELSKIVSKRRDSLSVKNALAGSVGSNKLRRKLKEIKSAIPAKSILKKQQHLDSSPELFSDDEVLESRFKPVIHPVHKEHEELYVTQTDRKLFKRAQESITGVLPPPSVTILQITIDEMLGKIKENTHLFWNNPESSSNNEGALTSEKCESSSKRESLLIRCKETDFNSESWPDILNHRYHGLHFNRNTLSEDFESLCTKYTERCIGAETQSSCTVFGINAVQSPSKHKCRLKRTTKSPGKRLSHLARRRITFSKDSLNSSVSGSCAFGARTRQIMVDVRKSQMLKHKSPRKKTPVKSPRKKITPSSSAKKRFSRRLRMYSIDDSSDSVASTSTSNCKLSATKRALFQSPSQKSDNGSLTQSNTKVVPTAESGQSATRRTPRRALFPSPLKTSPAKMTISSLYPPKRKLTPKRALFTSPEKLLRSSSANDRKRKRTDSDCEQPSKAVKNLSEDVKKDGIHNATKVSMSSATTQNITDNRKKKLMWAVAEALRLQNIDIKHPQFKVYASVLARVIRSFLPNLFVNGSRSEGGTTESMLRIARKYVFAVTRGKSVDYIMKEAENEKLKVLKPSGYVGPNKTECSNSSQSKHREGVLQDRLNIISTEKDVSENNKSVRRGGNVERIRKVINFGDDDVKNTSIR